MFKITDFLKKKRNKQAITMLTCYDSIFSQLFNHTPIDAILVGDSTAMVSHGHKSTITATIEMMISATKSVACSNNNQAIVADLPFLSYRISKDHTMRSVLKLMQAGAHGIKLEGSDDNCPTIEYIVKSGVPVMGHIGLTPQHLHQLGGYRVQGKTQLQAQKLISQAKQLESAGCFAIVLECIPSSLAKQISNLLKIPCIGIGAGQSVDGQILVLYDLLGLNNQFQAKFCKKYLNGFDLVQQAISRYCLEVKNKKFPLAEHSFQTKEVLDNASGY